MIDNSNNSGILLDDERRVDFLLSKNKGTRRVEKHPLFSHPRKVPFLLEVIMPRPFGYKHTKETKEKISIGNLGNKNALGFKNALGYRHTKESKKKMKENHYNQSGNKSNSWKGDNAGYFALHIRVRKLRGKPCFCETCKTTDKRKVYEWANQTGDFKNIMDYKRLCKSCHNKNDKRKEKLNG